LSTRKSEKIPDSDPTNSNWVNWATNLSTAGCSGTFTSGGLQFDLAQTVNYPPTENEQIIQLLTDIWHNQATMIKWLSKIAEKGKKPSKRKKAS